MNKVFKVIWNHATQTWTAVSELGHAKGKTKSKKIVKLTALAGAVIGSLAVSQTATASADLTTNDAVNIAPNNVPNPTAGREAVAVGPNASHQHSIAIGRNATAQWTNSISIGKDTVSSQDHAVAMGTSANASGIQSVGVGSYTKAEGNLVVAVGPYAQANKEAAIAVGSNATAAESNSVAVGQTATAAKNNSIAIGTKTKSDGDNAIGIGAYTESTGLRATAVGPLAQANGAGSFAGGASAQATGENSVAIGGATDGTLGNATKKAGTAAKATGNQAIALGTQSNASGENSIAQGNAANASATNATAIGTESTASGQYATALGTASNATAIHTVAIGSASTASKDGAFAGGYNSTAAGKKSVSLGFNAQANHENSVALGSGSVTSDAVKYPSHKIAGKDYDFAGAAPTSVVSVGAPVKGGERQIQNVAAGRISKTSTDAVNGSQLYAVADAVSNHHWVIGGNTTAQNTAAPTVSDEFDVKNKDIVEFQNGNGTKATIEYTNASQSSGTPAKTVVKYHANIVKGDNTEVVYNANGSVQINAKAGKDTTAAVTTKTPDALKVTSKTENNVTTYNVDAQTGSISTTDAGSAAFKENGDVATGGNYGSRLTNVSTVTDIVNNVSWHLNSSAVPGSGGKITDGSDTKAADVKASNTVNINAGKNIEIKRNGTTIEISSTAAGEKGDTGATGAKGEKGDTGATGAKGDTGEKGGSITGEVVDNGDGTHTITITDLETGSVTTTIVKDGKNGKDGKDGATGAKGDTGATGAKGDTGAAGAKGDTGEKGDTGAAGAKGDTGEKGDSITGEVVNNGDGTHTITITNLGDGSVTTTIVKDGKNGKDGATGAKGEKGDTGAAGAKGDTGAKGEKGDTGAAGAKGEKGDTGAVGAKGDTGAKGEKGDTGAAGAKGDKGDKGDKGEDGVMTWDIKSTGNKAEGSEEAAKTIKHKNTVDMAAGKNLTVKQTSDENGAKVEFALNSTVTNLDKVVVNGPKGPKGPNGEDGEDGKDGVTITAPVKGKDGLDGKVGISGKDGKDAVSISGKDGVGQIGLTGPKGKDGKDGASINITTDNGEQTLVNPDRGVDGEPGKTAQRIIYVPTDKDGNPLKDEKGNIIKREVATMDDGLVFGGNTKDVHKAKLGTQVNVKGATGNTEWSKFDAGQNIMTKVEGNTITVGLAKDLEVNSVNVTTNVTAGNVTATGTISAPTIKAGDTTITNGKVANLKHHIENPTTVVDDKVLNITDGEKKEAATVRDVLNSGWNLQANGNAVDAVTHGNTVNFVDGKGITVKAEPNKDGTTSKVSFDVNVDNDTITVNEKGQLVSNGSTNFNVATKDGGNKVAKKGGSSTAKITSGKTITYTAGKNIAIEQNGGDILVSTTEDVNHNSVTTNDLTVNKGGNIDMGGNQIHNVKAGTKDTDAVNVSQLKQSIGDVHKRINKVGKEARGGIAGANAAAGLPQVYIPGKSMVAASAGTFKGESAVAVGYSRSSDNGKVIFKLQGNANTQGDVGGSVGVGYQW